MSSSKDDELSTAEVIQVLDELASLGLIKITFTGGEVGLRKDLSTIVAAASQRHFVISLKTTAVLFETEDVVQLYQNGVHNLTLTLLHVDAEAHDSFVGHPGAFKKALTAARAMKDLGGQVHVTIPVMGWNIAVVPQLIRWCDELGLQPRHDFRMFPALNRDASPTQHRASESEIDQLLQSPEIAQASPLLKSAESLICAAGSTDVHFCANGDVWPCTLMPIALGNVKTTAFADIWQGSEVVRMLRQLRWGDSSECMSCQSSRYCGRCPANAFLEHGDLTQHASQDCHLANMFRKHVERDEDDS